MLLTSKQMSSWRWNQCKCYITRYLKKNKKNKNLNIDTSYFRLPSIKDLDVEQRQESYLTVSFIHPLVQALFSFEFTNRVCSLLASRQNKRSTTTIVTNIIMSYQFKYNCY